MGTMRRAMHIYIYIRLPGKRYNNGYSSTDDTSDTSADGDRWLLLAAINQSSLLTSVASLSVRYSQDAYQDKETSRARCQLLLIEPIEIQFENGPQSLRYIHFHQSWQGPREEVPLCIHQIVHYSTSRNHSQPVIE